MQDSDDDRKQCVICVRLTMLSYKVHDPQVGDVTVALCERCWILPGVFSFIDDLVHGAKFLWCSEGVPK